MAVFTYTGRSRRGDAVGGRVEADTATAAAAQLQGGGITPTRIAPEAPPEASASAFSLPWRRGSVKTPEVALLSRQLYTLTRAGIPILRAIHGLAQTTRNPLLAHALEDISDSLRSGRDLGTSMQRHSEIFPPLVVSLVRVGEDSGRLEDSFEQITEYLERDMAVRKQVKAATRYPAFVGISIVVAIGILNALVIPAFARAFAKFDGQLPLPTRILIATSDFTVAWWPWLLTGIGALVFGLRYALRTPGGRMRWHRAQLRLPAIGSIIERGILARFARSFAMTMRSGVSLTQSLSLVAQVVDNDHVQERIQGMRTSIERGETLTQAASAAGVFTPLALQMLAVGEESGAVEDLCHEVAEYYEREVAYEVARIGDAIEPILIGAIGAVVLILALGVYLPMWDLATAMKGG